MHSYYTHEHTAIVVAAQNQATQNASMDEREAHRFSSPDEEVLAMDSCWGWQSHIGCLCISRQPPHASSNNWMQLAIKNKL